jgi:hypothetical protein
MKVICIDNRYYPLSLEIGKEYKVIKEENEFYFIEDFNGEEYFYPKNLFEIKH